MLYIYLHYYIIPTSFAYFWHTINVFYSVAKGTKFFIPQWFILCLKAYLYLQSLLNKLTEHNKQ